MGIGNAEATENRGFKPFHGQSFGLILMIIAQNMKEAMKNEMG